MAREMKKCASREQSHAGMNSAEVQPIFERKLKDSGVKWIGEIPTNWLSASVGHLFRIKAGGDAKPDLYEYEYDDEHIYPVYTNTLDKNQVYAYSSKAYFHGPCITVTGRGAVGHAIYRENAFDAIIRLLVLTPRMKVSCRYYTYFIDYVCHFFTNNATIGQLSAEQIFPAKVCRPPLSEQQAIADFLDKKCAEIDGLLADLETEVKTLAEYKKSIIAETVTRGLNPNAPTKQSGIPWAETIPAHWDIQKGKYTFRLLQRPVKEDDGVITCFRDGEVTLRSNRREDGFTMSAKEYGYQGIEPGDLVVHGMDGFAGSIGISDSRGKGTPVLNVLDSKYNKRYLMFYLRNMAYGDVFLALSTGIRVRSCDLGWKKLGEIRIVLPPIEEQEKIADYIDHKLDEIQNAIVNKTQQIETLKAYKSSLIYEYVTGKKQVI